MESDSPSPASLVPLLRSNDAPTLFQKNLVEGILRDKQAELSALGDEISRLEDTLFMLRKKQADLTAEMHEYNCILSPIRHVPPDVIGEIFLYFAPSIMHPSDFRSNSVFDPWSQDDVHTAPVRLPWKLGHICQQWRTISLSLSQLWTVLDLGPQWRFRTEDFPVQRHWVDDEEGFTSSAFLDAPALPSALPVTPALHIWDDWDSEYRSRPSDYEDSKSFEIATSLGYIEEYLQRSAPTIPY